MHNSWYTAVNSHKEEREEKVSRAFSRAYTRLISLMDDIDKTKQLNQLFSSLVATKEEASGLGLSDNHFDISEADIETFKKVQFTTQVAKNYQKSAVEYCTVDISSLLDSGKNCYGVPIVCHPYLVRDLSQNDLEKVFLHEMAHVVHFVRGYQYNSKFNKHDPERLQYRHLNEFIADGLSDFVKPYPSMSEVHRKLVWVHREEHPEFLQHIYNYGSACKSGIYKDRLDEITDTIIKSGKSSKSHPSVVDRVKNSVAIVESMVSERCSEYLSNLYGVTLPVEEKIGLPQRVQNTTSSEEFKDSYLRHMLDSSQETTDPVEKKLIDDHIKHRLYWVTDFEDSFLAARNPPVELSGDERLNILSVGLQNVQAKEGHILMRHHSKRVMQYLLEDTDIEEAEVTPFLQYVAQMQVHHLASDLKDSFFSRLPKSERVAKQQEYLAGMKEFIVLTQGYPKWQQLFSKQLVYEGRNLETKDLRNDAMTFIQEFCSDTAISQKAKKFQNSTEAKFYDFCENVGNIAQQCLGNTMLGDALGIEKKNSASLKNH